MITLDTNYLPRRPPVPNFPHLQIVVVLVDFQAIAAIQLQSQKNFMAWHRIDTTLYECFGDGASSFQVSIAIYVQGEGVLRAGPSAYATMTLLLWALVSPDT
jgi:hypothetical protein